MCLFAIIYLTGCASVGYEGSFQKTGNFDPIESLSVTKAANTMKWAEASDIEVYFVEPPKGIEIDNSNVKYDESIWENLGSVELEASTLNFFGKYPEDEDWKNIYCPVNGALVYGTLFLWSITPFPWPCSKYVGNSPEAIAERKVRMANTMKKIAKAAGGDVVVVTGISDRHHYDEKTRIIFSTEKSLNASGVIFRRKPKHSVSSHSI